MRLQSIVVANVLLAWCGLAEAQTAISVKTTDIKELNKFYVSNKAPLRPSHFVKLPVGAVKPGGWLKKQLELQRDGLTGNLGDISIWLSKQDNAWLNKEGKGTYGWEELPYWLKGYGNIAYVLNDPKMLEQTKFWIEAVLTNQRENGDFGPAVERGEGKRDLWTNMPMLWCLQSYYEYSGDKRVLDLMGKYFKWELSIPDDKLLEDYWENSRGGDNIISVYWLYNRTGEAWLLDLATKLHNNTANWRQKDKLPNLHNVNVAQGFREPATYYLQSNNPADLQATYDNHNWIRSIWGQVPGGMFGGDEHSREGYTDPRQAVETCGMVEQITSDGYLMQFTGDAFWADNCEDVAFNTFPAAFTGDYKSLRYLTAPNMVISDGKNHAPGIYNEGPFLNMNPFSSRCCQHNHTAGWVYYTENSWMATPDNGLVAQLYAEGEVKAKVGNGSLAKIVTTTKYPFEETVEMKVITFEKNAFPVYLRVPVWCNSATVKVNGKAIKVITKAGEYIKLNNEWKNGDRITLRLPMEVKIREWVKNKNSASVNYGPLTFSLKIDENYVKKDSKETAIHDSRWQENVDASKWPSWEIFPASAWNYGLILNPAKPEASFTVVRKAWPKDDNPFANTSAPPIQINAEGRQIPAWQIDQYGLCGILPASPVTSTEPKTALTLVPMGAARLRISSFPVIAQ
ncbi:hypothetical protein DJ568_08305 [Mucilaginibacter hurinus]|uniref:Transcriptional initiation protein Tat n=1 Tax=Mucilaginibacter hurinus TaxID=2201324 RepID=A0A367GR62_9SPHI|nr:beta-L-arabinofuranosidase domain-containing protein [Mucilaginibacter hurinus]RCH55181.1 hypothetical protein DJ568_08305 [Mucilaginibacter hurinus]